MSSNIIPDIVLSFAIVNATCDALSVSSSYVLSFPTCALSGTESTSYAAYSVFPLSSEYDVYEPISAVKFRLLLGVSPSFIISAITSLGNLNCIYKLCSVTLLSPVDSVAEWSIIPNSVVFIITFLYPLTLLCCGCPCSVVPVMFPLLSNTVPIATT